MKLNEAQKALRSAAEALRAIAAEIEAADEGADTAALEAKLSDAEAEHERCLKNVEKAERVHKAANTEVPEVEKAEERTKTEVVEKVQPVEKSERIKVGKDNDTIYRADKETSFFRDLYLSQVKHDAAALARLERNQREQIELRDMSGASTQGSEFLPPIYLADIARNVLTAGRPFANVVPKRPLPTYGTAIQIPKLTSGVSVANRAGNGSVSETDGVTASVTSTIQELAGQVDVDRIAVMRSFPGLDEWLYSALVKRYNAALDTQLLAGSGSGANLLGLHSVSGVNTVAYTTGSPTAAGLIPKLYDAIQKVAVNRLDGQQADMIVMHPRRAAWIAAGLSTSFPLLQQGGLLQANGQQDEGFAGTIAGLPVVLDANIAVNYGASTNEDEIYVIHSGDMVLMEGPLNSRVFEDVGSGTGTIRLQLFAHVGFVANLYPESITIVSSTGLVTPTF